MNSSCLLMSGSIAHLVFGQGWLSTTPNRAKTGPRSPGRGPKALLRVGRPRVLDCSCCVLSVVVQWFRFGFGPVSGLACLPACLPARASVRAREHVAWPGAATLAHFCWDLAHPCRPGGPHALQPPLGCPIPIDLHIAYISHVEILGQLVRKCKYSH